MKKFYLLFLIFFITPCLADQGTLTTSLQKTYTACIGIDDDLEHLKTMAGINTAVTGVGTAAGAGATIVGIMRKNELFPNLKNKPEPDNTGETPYMTIQYNSSFQPNLLAKNSRTKKLGDWRTGLLAVNTTTNVAGAIIAGKNTVDDELQQQIENCRSAVKNLRVAITQARTEGIDVTEATEIASACGDFDYIDITPINKRAKGAMISAIIGAATGVAGTITSVAANKQGQTNVEKLDNTSNVLAGGATIASGAATIFNATQIAAIKKVVNTAEKCSGALK